MGPIIIYFSLFNLIIMKFYYEKKNYILNMLLLVCIGFSSCAKESSSFSDSSMQDDSTKVLYADTYVEFPYVDEIISEPTVIQAMDQAWSLMEKNSTSSAGRIEYGFWIYYNFKNGSIWPGDMIEGDNVIGCEGTNGQIRLGIPVDNISVCACFHCHTTVKFCPTYGRYTGPSSSDDSFVNSYNIPGILYDYDTNFASINNDGEQPKIYTFGPSRRSGMKIPKSIYDNY